MTSTTFIRREIEAIEARGQPVARFAGRRWSSPLVDPEDVAEQARTEYLLTGNAGRLIRAAMAETITNLPRLIATLPLWSRVYRLAGSGLVRHLAYLMQAMLFRRRAAALGIDHVHAHFSTNAACIAMLAHALGGPTYSFTVHGPDELEDPKRGALAVKVAHAAFVVAISGYCRDRIAGEAPDHVDRIRVIRCGLDLDDFPFDADPPARGDRLVCVGRLCANKAQTLIPAAVAAIRADFPDVRVDLIGDGDDRPAIEAEIDRLGLGDNVRLLGWAPANKVRDRIRASSALLLPSLAEGLPIVLMEAMAIGRPVLTTTVAGIPELVDDHCGWIVPPGSVDAIARALRGLLSASRDERLALGAEGRRRIEAAHDIGRSADQLLAAFAAAAVTRR